MATRRTDHPNAAAGIGKYDSDLLERWNRKADAKKPAKDGRGAPLGNENGRTRGIYCATFVTDAERGLFESILARLHQDFVFNRSSDLMQVELVAVYFLRLARSQELGDYDAAQKLDGMIRAHLKELKTTKLSREGDQPRKPESSPAEWATKVLEKAKYARKKAAAKTAAGGADAAQGGGVEESDPEEPEAPEIEPREPDSSEDDDE